MSDVKTPVNPGIDIQGEAAPSAPSNPTGNQTPVENQPTEVAPLQPSAVPGERMIPYSRFKEVNEQRRQLQRENAARQAREQLQGYDPVETEKVMGHPIVQKLLIDHAKTQVTDFAKDYLDQYPEFPPVVKKAILKNVRGFINEDTTDPETAKEDVRAYIDEIWGEVQADKPKGPTAGNSNVPVITATNAGGLPQNAGTKPKNVQDILNKPLLEWTDEDTAAVELYSKTHKK